MGDFDVGVILRSWPFLLEGMQITILLTLCAVGGGIVLGTVLALFRLSSFKPLSMLAGAYVNFFRAMPLILVIFWFFFLVPLLIGRPLGNLYSALITFIVFEASYYCEIIRAGIQSVPRGQSLSAKATGLSYLQAMLYVVLPQAFRNMIPILLTQAIILFQDTSLVFVVGLRDFLTAADVIASRDGRLVEMYSFVAIVYLVICLAGSLGAKRMRRRYTV